MTFTIYNVHSNYKTTLLFKDIMKELKIQCLDYELETMAKCQPYFNDKIFYDIGCYLGLWSIGAFLCGAKYVIGFDLYPTEEIIRNLAPFAPGYRILNCIVTNDEGLDTRFGAFRTTIDKFYKEMKCVEHMAEGYTLDKTDYKDDIFAPGFMKIDVEGSELDVLDGATWTITKFKPSIMIESHDYMKEGRKEEIMAILEKWGYNKPEFVTKIEDGRVYHIFWKSPK